MVECDQIDPVETDSRVLINILWNILAPIFLVAGVGLLGRRRLHLDSRTFSAAAFYILTPSLVFDSLFRIQIAWQDLGRVLGFCVAMLLALLTLGFAIARGLRWGRAMTSAFILTLVLLNNGNYGIPLNRFAFGAVGSELAVLYYTVNAVFGNTFGVFIASSGKASVRQALRGLLRVPMIYATVLALLLRALAIAPPVPLMRAVGLLGEAAVPVMMMILGMQLASMDARSAGGPAWIATGIRLVVSPLLAVAFTDALGMEGMIRVVGITQWGTPTAVLAAVLATQYDCQPRYVAVVIFITTLLSVVTMPILLSQVGGALVRGAGI